MRPREGPALARWREASQRAVETTKSTGEWFMEYLAQGGPDAIKSLQATVRRLQGQLEEMRQDGRLERFRKLQKDLEEADKVCASLRQYIITQCEMPEDQVDAWLHKKLFKASTLYGASRELLLRENRILRSQLEEHLVTSRTSRAAAGGPGAAGSPAGPGAGLGPGGGRSPMAESKLRQARMLQGPHMEVVGRLLDANGELAAAERGFQLPSVRHAEVEADDGSRRLIATLEGQVAVLAGQKVALLSEVAGLKQQNGLLDMKLEAAHDQLVEMRRQKTDMLAHQDNLSKDLRDHLLAEAKRADAGELAAAEARAAEATARQAAEAARASMEKALAEAQAMQAALQEKTAQVDTLRGLYLELRETLEALAGDVASGQQEAARRMLAATREQLDAHRTLLEDVKGSAVAAHRAAQTATAHVTELAAQQRALAAEAQTVNVAATTTLGALERQLGATQQLLAHSEADRARIARQAIAARALERIEDKRHERTVKLLLHEVPEVVAGRLQPKLEALADGAQALADEAGRATDQLAAGGAGQGAGAPLLHAPMVPDVADDATSQLLTHSRLLRSQLHQLAGGAPGPGPALNAASLFRALPPGLGPLPDSSDHVMPPATINSTERAGLVHRPGPGEVEVAWEPPYPTSPSAMTYQLPYRPSAAPPPGMPYPMQLSYRSGPRASGTQGGGGVRPLTMELAMRPVGPPAQPMVQPPPHPRHSHVNLVLQLQDPQGPAAGQAALGPAGGLAGYHPPGPPGPHQAWAHSLPYGQQQYGPPSHQHVNMVLQLQDPPRGPHEAYGREMHSSSGRPALEIGGGGQVLGPVPPPDGQAQGPGHTGGQPHDPRLPSKPPSYAESQHVRPFYVDQLRQSVGDELPGLMQQQQGQQELKSGPAPGVATPLHPPASGGGAEAAPGGSSRMPPAPGGTSQQQGVTQATIPQVVGGPLQPHPAGGTPHASPALAAGAPEPPESPDSGVRQPPLRLHLEEGPGPGPGPGAATAGAAGGSQQLPQGAGRPPVPDSPDSGVRGPPLRLHLQEGAGAVPARGPEVAPAAAAGGAAVGGAAGGGQPRPVPRAADPESPVGGVRQPPLRLHLQDGARGTPLGALQPGQGQGQGQGQQGAGAQVREGQAAGAEGMDGEGTKPGGEGSRLPASRVPSATPSRRGAASVLGGAGAGGGAVAGAPPAAPLVAAAAAAANGRSEIQPAHDPQAGADAGPGSRPDQDAKGPVAAAETEAHVWVPSAALLEAFKAAQARRSAGEPWGAGVGPGAGARVGPEAGVGGKQ